MRYAIRSMLNRLAPLHEPNASGYSLIPVFVEYGAELASYFDLDVSRLGQILNGDDEDATPNVEQEDLVLLSMSGLHQTKVHAKLREIQEQGVEHSDVPETLRTYFYDKYIYRPAKEKGTD